MARVLIEERGSILMYRMPCCGNCMEMTNVHASLCCRIGRLCHGAILNVRLALLPSLGGTCNVSCVQIHLCSCP